MKVIKSASAAEQIGNELIRAGRIQRFCELATAIVVVARKPGNGFSPEQMRFLMCDEWLDCDKDSVRELFPILFDSGSTVYPDWAKNHQGD